MESYRQFKEALENQIVELEKFPDLKGSNLAQRVDKLRENRVNLVVLGAF
jgi:hypothetical protein